MPNCACCGAAAEIHKTINCCICNKSYKIDCVNVSSTEVRKIHQKTGFTWTCKICLKFGNDLNSLKSALASLQDEIKVLKDSILETSSCSNRSLIDMEKIIREVSERNKRRDNIVIFGSDESDCSTNKEQVDLDVPLVSEICSVLGVTSENLKVSRLGKFDVSQPNRRRPIRVVLSSERNVIDALRNVPKLKSNTKFKHLSLFRDRTPLQMQIHREAKVELDTRVRNGESNLRIKYEKGIPRIVSSLN